MSRKLDTSRRWVRSKLGRARDRTVTALAERTMRSGAPMAALLGDRMVDAVDAAASRLLASDDAAAQLAYVVERLTADVSTDKVVAAVLQHNLLLDGTVLQLIRPLLAGIAAPDEGTAVPDVSPETLARGRQTLITLLEALQSLRDGDDSATDDLDEAARLMALADKAPDLPLDILAPLLSGARPPDETTQFVLGSYALFLQTFLLRSSLRLVPQALSGRQERLK